jgi:hypothetical protein
LTGLDWTGLDWTGQNRTANAGQPRQDSYSRTARTWIVGQDLGENEDVLLRRGRGFGADILIAYCFLFF